MDRPCGGRHRVPALCGNIAECGSQIHKFVAGQKGFNMYMFVETHLNEELTSEVHTAARKDGWKMVATPVGNSG
eukprot:901666-Pyramimonas_sp.AAC.1